jgi:hypothetical protein
MSAPSLQCPRCQALLPDNLANQPDLSPCPACGTEVQIAVFPAIFQTARTGTEAENILIEGESGCFYHPQKRANATCDLCGRFLCALCDCEWQGRHLCPPCLETGRTKGKVQTLEQRRTLYDQIALSLAILPLITIIGFFLTIVTAPLVLFIVIRYWKRPGSMVQRSRIRFVIAFVLAVLQIAAWCLILFFRP